MAEKPITPPNQHLGLSLSRHLLAKLNGPGSLGQAEPVWAIASEAITPGVGLWHGLANPVQRRSWLLLKALEIHTLEHALELAQRAEAFLLGADYGKQR